MAAFVRFHCFAGDLARKVHDLFDDELIVYLSDSEPDPGSHKVMADVPEIALGHGYKGPQDTQNVAKLDGSRLAIAGRDLEVKAEGGRVGPFRYVVLANASAGDTPLIGYWDKGQSITLDPGESFSTGFGASMFTIG